MMGKHKTSQPGNFALTWRRMSSRGLWSLGLFWFSAVVFGFATFFMDFLRTDNCSWLWFVTYSGSLGIAVALGFAAKIFLVNRVPERAVGAANTLAGLVIGCLKNLSVAVMAMALGLEKHVDLVSRSVGGALMGGAIIASYAAITGARAAHAQSLATLNAVRQDLLGSKENLDVLLADELERLQEKSRETVLPKIAQISQLLKNATTTSELIGEISETVTTRLRPLMQEISQQAKSTISATRESSAANEKVKLPKAFVARDVIRPLTYLAYDLPAIGFLTYYFQGLDGALFGSISTLTFVAFMWLFKVAVLPKRATGRLASYSMLALAGLLAPVVGLYIIGGALPMNAHQSVLVPLICWIVHIATVVFLVPVFLRDSESARLEGLIEAENELLAKEIAVFEQKLWVFKRRWLFMLHGTVQSALTAALTRLQTFAESDPYQVSLVQADLERAERALTSVPSNELDFNKSVQELKDSWAGVCSITIDTDMRAERALATNQGSAYCVNEILKEAVGNAVRHGSATAVLVKLTRDKDDFIDVSIQNDGSAPPKRRKKGIGSRMLDDITFSWSLERSGRLTTLKARLPL
jgi:signal transduction histidine kinase